MEETSDEATATECPTIIGSPMNYHEDMLATACDSTNPTCASHPQRATPPKSAPRNTRESQASTKAMPNSGKDDDFSNEQPLSPPTRFEFIDINSSTARKQARAHVMREFMRQKRQDREASANLPEERLDSFKTPKVGSTRASPRSSVSESSDTALMRRGEPDAPGRDSNAESQTAIPPDVELPDADSSTSLQYGSAVTNTRGETRHNDWSMTSASPRTRNLRSESPLTPLDSNRRDPFQSYPMPLAKEDIPLVDHYLSVLPELMCNFNGMRLRSSTSSFNPARDIILPQALHHPIAFQATALAFAAGHLARLHGRVDTPQSIKHRVQSLQKIREHLFDQKDHSEDLDITIAMLSLSSCEDRFGDNKAAWIHMRASMNMLENFWGRLEFRSARRLCTYMNWVLITMTGYDPCALKKITQAHTRSPSVSSARRSSSISASTSRSKEVDDTLRAIHSFIDFLRRIEKTDRARLLSPAVPQARTRRKGNFQPGSALHTLLSSPLGNRHGVRSNQIQKSCRFASAMCIMAILLELNDAPAVVEEFLKRLSIRVIEQELDWNESTETLMWILLFGDDEAEAEHNHSELIWWLGRMMNVAKRLSDNAWKEVSDMFLRCLMMTSASAQSEEQFEAWLDILLQRLLAAPLSSHLGDE